MSRYEDIIHLPHHVSPKRPKMSHYDRAAQFSPFAALTGYEAANDEAGRLTQQQVTLMDNAMETLNQSLCYIQAQPQGTVTVEVEYFCPDDRKTGGENLVITGIVERIDTHLQLLRLDGGREVA